MNDALLQRIYLPGHVNKTHGKSICGSKQPKKTCTTTM